MAQVIDVITVALYGGDAQYHLVQFFDQLVAVGPRAVLDGVDFEGLDMTGWDLQGASLRNARLAMATLDDTHLEGADLENAVLTASSMVGTHLQGATMRGAFCALVDARDAHFENADVSYTSWRGAQLNEYAFRSCRARRGMESDAVVVKVEETRSLADRLLDEGLNRVRTSEGLERYFDVQSKLPNFSAKNVLRILAQDVPVTQLADQKMWGRQGRSVSDDAKPVRIWVRESTKSDQLREVLLYDVTQTIGSTTTAAATEPPRQATAGAPMSRLSSWNVAQGLESDASLSDSARAMMTRFPLKASLEDVDPLWVARATTTCVARSLGVGDQEDDVAPPAGENDDVLRALTIVQATTRRLVQVARGEPGPRERVRRESIRLSPETWVTPSEDVALHEVAL